MSTALATLTSKLAARLEMGDGTGLIDTLKATAFKSDRPATDDQMTALMIVANQYGLNPWTKEIYAFPDSRNGIVPVVGVDGWSRIINSHPQFDGMNFEQDAESCTCIIYRKDRSHPTRITEYMQECARPSMPPWKSHPRRMLRHKSMIQCARIAFGFGGIYDQDEAERVIEATTFDAATGEIIGASKQPAKPETPSFYPRADFEAKLPAWLDAIAKGKATADAVIAKASTKHPLTDEQKAAIRNAKVVAPAPAPAPAAPAITYAEVADKLTKATTAEKLEEAADLIVAVADTGQQEELHALYEQRVAAITAKE